jgi:hypothetical protein
MLLDSCVLYGRHTFVPDKPHYYKVNGTPDITQHKAISFVKNSKSGHYSVRVADLNKPFNVLWRNNGARLCNHCCSAKAIRITHSEGVFVALLPNKQCAFAILSSVACPALQYFSTLSQKQTGFSTKKKLCNIKCVFIFSTTFVWNISHSTNNSSRYHKCILIFM